MKGKIAFLIVALGIIAVLVWWFRRPSRAEQIASLTPRVEQQRLWREVASKNLAPGLDRVPIPGTPIQNPPPPLPPSRPASPGTSRLPAGVMTTIRLVRASPGGPWNYFGKAKVVMLDNERTDVDVAGRAVSFLAKLGGKPLPLTANQTIDFEYRTERGSAAVESVLAVQVDRNTAIAVVLKTGPSRIMNLHVGLLNLTLEQTGDPQNGAMPVRAIVPRPGQEPASGTIPPGTTMPVQVGDVFIRLEGSVAPPAGPPRTDGAPYAINAVAWRAAGVRQ